MEEDQGSLDRAEEGHTEASRNQAAADQSQAQGQGIQAQIQGCQGSHEVHQVLGSELVAGNAEAAAGREGNHKEGRVAAAGQADCGIGEAAGWDRAAEAAAGQGGLTVIDVSQITILIVFIP